MINFSQVTLKIYFLETRDVVSSIIICIQEVIYVAAGEPPSSIYRSVVYYQVKSPKFCETVKVGVRSASELGHLFFSSI